MTICLYISWVKSFPIGESATQYQQSTYDQSSQGGTVDHRQQAEEEPNVEEIKNDVVDAIQYTQNEDSSMRVINNFRGLVEELKEEKPHKD